MKFTTVLLLASGTLLTLVSVAVVTRMMSSCGSNLHEENTSSKKNKQSDVLKVDANNSSNFTKHHNTYPAKDEILPGEDDLNAHQPTAAPNHNNLTTSSSCTDYRTYPWPSEESGLPYLADVFATPDKEWVVFIGINRGKCWEKYKFFYGNPDQGKFRFLCTFHGGGDGGATTTTTIPVISEFVAPSASVHQVNFIFRCKLPPQFRHQVQPGQPSTNLHVDVQVIHESAEEAEYGRLDLPQSDSPKIPNIPICHPTPSALHADESYNLTAMTLIKSQYLSNHFISDTTPNVTTSTIYRIKEWIAYHQSQGFDHFVFYDNDQQPHGPLEALLQPYVQSGLATYRWFPLEDCHMTYGPLMGLKQATAQGAASVAALHRMGTRTRFFAHMDVDEFFVVNEKGDNNNQPQTTLQFLNRHLSASSEYDGVEFQPTVIEYCNGAQVDDTEAPPLKTRKCIVTDNHASDFKLIMRPEKVLIFCLHYPILTREWKETNFLRVEPPVGLLAHYKGDPPPGKFDGDSDTPFTRFDDFLATYYSQKRKLRMLKKERMATTNRT